MYHFIEIIDADGAGYMFSQWAAATKYIKEDVKDKKELADIIDKFIKEAAVSFNDPNSLRAGDHEEKQREDFYYYQFTVKDINGNRFTAKLADILGIGNYTIKSREEEANDEKK